MITPNLGFQYEINHPKSVTSSNHQTNPSDHPSSVSDAQSFSHNQQNNKNFQTFVNSNSFQQIPTTSQR